MAEEQINQHCVPVLKAEGLLLYILYKVIFRFPIWVMAKCVNILVIISGYINWCIAASIFRMGVIVGSPIISCYFLYHVNMNDSSSVIIAATAICLSMLAMFVVYCWVDSSYSSDIKYVRKIIMRDGR